MPHGRPLRLHHSVYSEPGSIASLTMCCRDHRKVFASDPASEIAVSNLHNLHGRSWSILCYVVMPDHVHSIVASRSASIIDFVRFFKGRSSTELRRRLGLRNVWQKSFHDQMVRQADDLSQISKYLLENPVRAGLVSTWQDWPWCGSCRWPDLGLSLEEFGFENIRWQDALTETAADARG